MREVVELVQNGKNEVLSWIAEKLNIVIQTRYIFSYSTEDFSKKSLNVVNPFFYAMSIPASICFFYFILNSIFSTPNTYFMSAENFLKTHRQTVNQSNKYYEDDLATYDKARDVKLTVENVLKFLVAIINPLLFCVLVAGFLYFFGFSTKGYKEELVLVSYYTTAFLFVPNLIFGVLFMYFPKLYSQWLLLPVSAVFVAILSFRYFNHTAVSTWKYWRDFLLYAGVIYMASLVSQYIFAVIKDLIVYSFFSGVY